MLQNNVLDGKYVVVYTISHAHELPEELQVPRALKGRLSVTQSEV